MLDKLFFSTLEIRCYMGNYIPDFRNEWKGYRPLMYNRILFILAKAPYIIEKIKNSALKDRLKGRL